MLDQYVQNAYLTAAYTQEAVALEQKRPFMLLKPRVFTDGNQWCALYGESLQDGVAGFGDTPAKAATDFDLQWLNASALKALKELEGEG